MFLRERGQKAGRKTMRGLDPTATGIFRAILAELGNRDYCRIDKAPGIFMPLSVDRIGKNHFSLAHNGERNGDLMADPDMVFWIDPEGKIYPYTFQNDYMGIYQEALEFDGDSPCVFNHYVQRKLAVFADQWMRNIAAQQGIKAAAE
jgi:hypothetical protein